MRKNLTGTELAGVLTAVLAVLYSKKVSGTLEEAKMAQEIAELIHDMTK